MLNDLHALIRYFVVLKYIDDLTRIKAIRCYFEGFNYRRCAERYMMSPTTLKNIVRRLPIDRTKPGYVRLTLAIIDAALRLVPTRVDNFVGARICRLCRHVGRNDVGAWIVHFENRHHDVLAYDIHRVTEYLRARRYI